MPVILYIIYIYILINALSHCYSELFPFFVEISHLIRIYDLHNGTSTNCQNPAVGM